ncbi:MAG: PEP-CTERM sorting domain-containing protein [Thermoguttaceae bacterium]|nr:PEP-CTERM sorting domain-containing protein [Thermoguttaceae bacterium]
MNWTGATDSKWSTASNWDGGTLPGTGDLVQAGTAYQAYTNALNIQDGDEAVVNQVNFSGGTIQMTGGSLTVTNDRLRVGSAAATTMNFSGGTLNLNGGLGLGGKTDASLTSTLNVSGSARMNVTGGCFIIHGNSNSNLNQSGGVIVNKCGSWNQVGENNSEANLNLTGGAFYNTANAYFFVGRNNDGSNAGKGLINLSGGQFYTAGTLQLGNKKGSDQAGKYGRVVLNSGILSARRLTFDVRQGELQLKGGTFVTSEVNRNLTNSGSTIEIASTSSFNITEANIDGLAANETWFSKYQKGTIGTLAVSGTFSQTSGSVVLDLTDETTYDKLTAGSFNVTGGDLVVSVNVNGITKEMVYAVFGDNPTGNLNFSRIVVNNTVATNWKIMDDGKLVRIYAETFKWTGSESGDWNTRANWGSNDSGYAPESLDTVQVGSFYNAYTNELTIKDGDDVKANIMYLNGGKMSVTGGTLTVVSDRLRVGNEGTASNEIVFSGGTTNFQGGLGVGGGSTTTAKTHTLTVTDDARVNLESVFVLHGYSPSTLNQEGGVIFNDNTSSGAQYTQIGEGGNEANLNLNGGAFYNVTSMYVGRNQGGNNAGKGLLSVDGGQMYIGGTLVIGFSGTADATGRYGIVELKSGILSATNINFGTKTGELKLEGGTFVAQKVTGDLVNVGSTVEIAAKFTPSEENVNALADGETWYSKYQEGTVGKLTVTGTYTQTGGTLEIDLVGPDSYDVLTVGNFDVTQGDLKLNVSDSLARSLVGGERFSVFGANPSGILQFANIIPSFGNSFQWVLEEDGILTYYNSNQIPEPAAWLLLLTGAALVGFSRKFKVCKS